MIRKTFASLIGGTLLLSACMSPPLDGTGAANAEERAVVSTSNSPRQVANRGTNEQEMQIFLTGYSYWDNTPPGSAAIARPVVHRRAAGTGTYSDPITIAVGYSLANGRTELQYPAGTRFYLPRLKKYAIVEDICGEGPSPQTTGCWKGRNGRPHLDIYVGGARHSKEASNSCMYRLTGFHSTIMNPAPTYPVVAGELTETGCQVF